MTDFFTGLDAVPGEDQKTDLFNKTAINADNLIGRVGHHGAKIRSVFQNETVQFTKSEPFLIPMTQVDFDTDGFFNPQNPGRLTVPPNISFIELWATMIFIPGNWQLRIFQTGSGDDVQDLSEVATFQTGKISGTNKYGFANCHTGLLSSTAGNYFECFLTQTGSGVDNFNQTSALFSISSAKNIQTLYPDTFKDDGVSLSTLATFSMRAYKS